MFLVIVGRADMVDQVVADDLRAKRTPSRLFYSVRGFFWLLRNLTEYMLQTRWLSYQTRSSNIQSRTRVSIPESMRGQRWLASRLYSDPHRPLLRRARERGHRFRRGSLSVEDEGDAMRNELPISITSRPTSRHFPIYLSDN